MKKYKLVVKGIMKKMDKFEEELNSHYRSGWTAVSMTCDMNGKLVVLMERGNENSVNR